MSCECTLNVCLCRVRWLGVWIEVVSSCVVFAATVFAILTPDISAAQAGLSITYALQVSK